MHPKHCGKWSSSYESVLIPLLQRSVGFYPNKELHWVEHFLDIREYVDSKTQTSVASQGLWADISACPGTTWSLKAVASISKLLPFLGVRNSLFVNPGGIKTHDDFWSLKRGNSPLYLIVNNKGLIAESYSKQKWLQQPIIQSSEGNTWRKPMFPAVWLLHSKEGHILKLWDCLSTL